MRGAITKATIRTLDVARLLPRHRPPEASHLITGRRGEEEAYFHLRGLGYIMVARNFRSPRCRGEIDLIGWDDGVLCFIEVKTRSSREVKPAEAAVDEHKKRDLVQVARDYWRRLPERPNFRFDIVSVYCENGGASEISLFKNAFSVP